MKSKENYNRGQSIQFLFTLLLMFFLAISALFTILFGAKLYENIGSRMEENFSNTTSLSYISNKIRQGDKAGKISVEELEGTQVLKIVEIYDEERYNTLIYCKNGNLKELFCSEDSDLSLNDGIDIMELENISFEMISEDVLKVESLGRGRNSLILALRSEVKDYE